MSRLTYVEPEDYIPEDLRKKYKLGEYAEEEEPTEEEKEQANNEIRNFVNRK